MTEPPSRRPDLRESLRPAVVAYHLLAGQRDRVGALALEAERLLADTREFLRTADLAYLADDGPASGPERASDTGIAELHADAVLGWAQVLGTAARLADLLITDGRFAEAKDLAAALTGAGEAWLGKRVRAKAEHEIRYGPLLRLEQSIHQKMSVAEAYSIICSLRDLIIEDKERSDVAFQLILPLNKCILNGDFPRLGIHGTNNFHGMIQRHQSAHLRTAGGLLAYLTAVIGAFPSYFSPQVYLETGEEV